MFPLVKDHLMLPQLTPPQHGGHAVIVLRAIYIEPSFLSLRAHKRVVPLRVRWGNVILLG